MGFPGGSAVRNPPAMQETWAWSLGREDPLEKEVAIHSKILAWEIPWTEEPGGPWVHCVHWVTRVGRTQWLNHHHLFTFSNIKKKNKQLYGIWPLALHHDWLNDYLYFCFQYFTFSFKKQHSDDYSHRQFFYPNTHSFSPKSTFYYLWHKESHLIFFRCSFFIWKWEYSDHVCINVYISNTHMDTIHIIWSSENLQLKTWALKQD